MRAAGARDDDPGGFHLGQTGDFAEAADDVDGDVFESGGKGGGGGGDRVVEEDFVDDEGEVEVAADAREFACFPGLGEMAGRIVGVYEHDGAGLRGDGFAESGGVDLPSMVVQERNGPDEHIVKVGEEVE